MKEECAQKPMKMKRERKWLLSTVLMIGVAVALAASLSWSVDMRVHIDGAAKGTAESLAR
jgi:hypothetical protein